MVEKLFENFSMKFRNENALSDITWVMCETSENFRDLFLCFFFPTEKFNNIQFFQREYSQGDSRPDFYIKNGDDVYLIEVKINDNNHHFEQYTNEFKIDNARLGYIVNYPIFKNNYVVKTWEDFYNYLDQEKDNCEKNERILIEGYLAYIKNVCSIVKVTNKMNLENLQTVLDFNETLKKATNFETDNYRIEIYSQNITHNRTGFNFKVSDLKNVKETIRIWIGAYFSSDDNQLCISVENSQGWGLPFYKMIESNNLFEKRKEKEGNLIFIFPKEKKGHFNTLNSQAEQQSFLKNFIEEVVMTYVR